METIGSNLHGKASTCAGDGVKGPLSHIKMIEVVISFLRGTLNVIYITGLWSARFLGD